MLSCVAVCFSSGSRLFCLSRIIIRHNIVSNAEAMCTCRYYRRYYRCMNDWLHSQHNCSSDVVSSILEAAHRYALPFTSRYDCPIVSNASTPGSFLQRAQCSHCKRCISYGNSVRPSVTRRYCVKTTARSTVQFAPLDSKMCLVL